VKRLIVMLVLGLVLLLALAAPTLGKKGERVTFDVDVTLRGDESNPLVVITAGGCSSWGGLDVQFRENVCGRYVTGGSIKVGGVELELVGIAVKRKHGLPDTVSVFFKDPVNGVQYESDSIKVKWVTGDITKDTEGFTIHVSNSGEVWPYGPKGKVERKGTVWVGDAVYTPTAP